MSTATMIPQTTVPTTGIVGNPKPVSPELQSPTLYRMTVEQYKAIVKAGILDETSRVHLIHGLLVSKMAKNSPHVIATGKTHHAIDRALPVGWCILQDAPIELIDDPSVPEPDLIVLRGELDDYDGRTARSVDVCVVIEISDSSLRADRTMTKADYAASGIPVYWIINLINIRIEVYTQPTGPGPAPDYGRVESFGPGDSVPLILDGREIARIAVVALFPPSILRKAEK